MNAFCRSQRALEKVDLFAHSGLDPVENGPANFFVTAYLARYIDEDISGDQGLI